MYGNAITAAPAELPTAHPPTWFTEGAVADADELALLQPDWQLRYDQLSPGRFQGTLRLIQLPQMRLVQETNNRRVRQRGQVGHHGVGFGLPMTLGQSAITSGHVVGANSLMVGRSQALDLCCPENFRVAAAVVDLDLLADVWQQIFNSALPGWIESEITISADSVRLQRLRITMDEAFHRVTCYPGLLLDPVQSQRLRDDLLLEWTQVLPVDFLPAHSSVKSIRARRRVVDRACQVMLDSYASAESMLQVCRTIGSSPRKLAYCFRDILGVSPARYQRAIRLNNLRRALKSAHDRQLGIQDIAARWGFYHMGQLAADYRRQFGESPSETRRQVIP